MCLCLCNHYLFDEFHFLFVRLLAHLEFNICATVAVNVQIQVPYVFCGALMPAHFNEYLIIAWLQILAVNVNITFRSLTSSAILDINISSSSGLPHKLDASIRIFVVGGKWEASGVYLRKRKCVFSIFWNFDIKDVFVLTEINIESQMVKYVAILVFTDEQEREVLVEVLHTHPK